ncbi:MAG: hypothetical protein A3F82_00425 [Deltaproteobacteria bacterium RIFCSPLOWO2_12_FULL_44_12]|nr:MAG: hypothetical protein A2712_04530 [Deltaproteobacteria bacterium RIFCSPHIGHO2_01_FULL_43_49]OGQ16445.1 MAG: hypothetical protein A3D22_02495 [Deltaproteobacteria bacterium RIFCSPHIGHO2_02_FULL_44_53]OGQ27727.1 MAG: hypothetical protein A3D98_08490 [Deltaproteobacteria bacterium RIFCSPHIGHO2_12_FULL_44_21]OGQ32963.1 MAG: hypothetical protein A2979_10425 [Deltaproteobacteria bacterium RIFCSPLOWO2_01_FULL_45_74]OGQ42065.1 MAG: hypothetical protein A3I70_10215 [Deltaproteobacteria bacterium 
MGTVTVKPTITTITPSISVPLTCKNGKKDFGETGIDCGGKCAPCKTTTFTIQPASQPKLPQITPGSGTTQPQPSCTDSDQSNDPTIAGSVSGTYSSNGNSFRAWDTCSSDGRYVIETICDSNNLPQFISTPCGEGHICKQGEHACQSGTLQEPTCTDSDGGDNASVAGTVTKQNANGGVQTGKDGCDPRGIYVLEAYCDGTSAIKVKYLACPTGEICKDGACQPGSPPEISCTDTDGLDKNTAGTVSGKNGSGATFSSTDHCSADGLFVHEYFCKPDKTPFSEKLPCGAGQLCQDGACRDSPNICIDTDPNNNPMVQGGGDYCEGQQLYQLNCQPDGTQTFSVTTCSGQCVNGECH